VWVRDTVRIRVTVSVSVTAYSTVYSICRHIVDTVTATFPAHLHKPIDSVDIYRIMAHHCVMPDGSD